MIREAISKVASGKGLSAQESKQVFDEIMGGSATEAQIASFITALAIKGESADEIAGAAKAMAERAQHVIYTGNADLLDVVGTGGDGKGAFNVSTASAIVAAGAGCIVAKHGNRSASGRCGAADVLEALGVRIDTAPGRNGEILSKNGFAFLFAQSHHPAMKFAAKTRKEIGIRTIFNVLGPITNPADASTYLLGACNEGLAKRLAASLAALNVKRALVVSGGGFDEATLTGKTTVFEVEGGKVTRKIYAPRDFGFKKCSEADLSASGAQESAKIIMGILEGKEMGAARDMVVLNAGLAIYANRKAASVKEGIAMAKESIDSKRALAKLNGLIEESKT